LAFAVAELDKDRSLSSLKPRRYRPARGMA